MSSQLNVFNLIITDWYFSCPDNHNDILAINHLSPQICHNYLQEHYSSLAVVWLGLKRWSHQYKVTLCQAQLVLRRVIICGPVNHLRLRNQPHRSTQPGQPSAGRFNKYQQKLVSKQAHHTIH